jgi:membrane protein
MNPMAADAEPDSTSLLDRLLGPVHRFDAVQQRHHWLAVPVAVWRKLSDAKVGNLAALLTFYAFVSLFPLLLVLTTVLGIVLHGNPDLQNRLLNSALIDFPVLGEQVKSNIHGFGRDGFGLVVAIVATLLGACGLARAAQEVVNTVWGVPQERRPDFVHSWLRTFGLIAVMGLGVLSTTVLSGVGELAGGVRFGTGLRVTLLAVSLVATIALFWLVMRLATATEIHGRQLTLSALLGGTFWQGMQWVGGVIAAHQLSHASALYGTFGLVLGLLAWLYLQGRLILFAVACDVVRVRREWPRSLFGSAEPGASERRTAERRTSEKGRPEQGEADDDRPNQPS